MLTMQNLPYDDYGAYENSGIAYIIEIDGLAAAVVHRNLI